MAAPCTLPCPPPAAPLPPQKCSVSCGAGIQVRQIECVDSFGALSNTCIAKKKPLMSQACTTGIPCSALVDDRSSTSGGVVPVTSSAAAIAVTVVPDTTAVGVVSAPAPISSRSKATAEKCVSVVCSYVVFLGGWALVESGMIGFSLKKKMENMFPNQFSMSDIRHTHTGRGGRRRSRLRQPIECSGQIDGRRGRRRGGEQRRDDRQR